MDGMNMVTLAQQAAALIDEAKAMQQACMNGDGKREYALAITELEYAQMRLSRASTHTHAPKGHA